MNLFAVALKNVKRNSLRSAAITVAISALAGMLFSLSLVYSALNHSIELSGRRLGADAMIVPAEYSGKTEDILLTGRGGSFMMRDSKSLRDEIRHAEGVQSLSAQLFVVSAALSCCAVSDTMLIGYEPETDFVITPWLKKHIADEKIGPDSIVVGADILADVGGRMKFYGHEFLIAGKLEPTGMRFIDSAVFIPMAGVRAMAAESKYKALKTLSIRQDEISSIMIKLKDGVNPEIFALRFEHDHPDKNVLLMSGILRSAKKHLIAPLKGMIMLTVLHWIVSLFLIGVIFKLSIDERRAELGVMKALGAAKNDIWGILLLESALLSAIGGVSGIAAGFLLVKSFSGLLKAIFTAPLLLPGAQQTFITAVAVLASSLCTGIIASLFAVAQWADVEPFHLMRGGPLIKGEVKPYE